MPGSNRIGWFAMAFAGIGGVVAPVAAMADGGAVRGSDPRSRAIIMDAATRSPTIAVLIKSLDQTDVVVLVQVTLMPVARGGDTRWLVAAGGCRYLVVRVDASRSPAEQMEWLGHELQHANEVAAASDVHDEAGLVRLMARIGRTAGDGRFETDAAVLAGRLVRAEVGGR